MTDELRHTAELIHYGKRGMKWGVRSARTTQIKNARAEVRALKKNYKTAKTPAAQAKALTALAANPNAGIARTLTTGEKMAMLIIAASGRIVLGGGRDVF